MSDLIDRQDAIDFIDAGHLCNPNEPRWSDNEVVNFLKSRPSAQTEIVRCKDCKWCVDLNHDGDYSCLTPYGFRYIDRLDWFCADAERR